MHEYRPTIVVSESEFFFCNLLIFFADVIILYTILSKILQKRDPNLICCILLMENGKDFNDPLLERQIIVLFKNIQFYDVTMTKFMLTSSIKNKTYFFFFFFLLKMKVIYLFWCFFHGLYVLLVIIVILANVSINIIHTMSIKHRFWEDLAWNSNLTSLWRHSRLMTS